MPSAGGQGQEAEGRQGSFDGMPRGRGAVRHDVGVGACGAGRERYTVGVGRGVEPSCRTTRTPLGRRSRTRPLVGTQHLDLTKSRLQPAMHAEIRFAFVKKMDRLLERSHAHSSDIMQGGRTWFQASISQQSTPRVCDALGLCGEAWQAEREREGRDWQHWSAGEVPNPGGACGFAPWSLCGAPAARRATGGPLEPAWEGFRGPPY